MVCTLTQEDWKSIGMDSNWLVLYRGSEPLEHLRALMMEGDQVFTMCGLTPNLVRATFDLLPLRLRRGAIVKKKRSSFQLN